VPPSFAELVVSADTIVRGRVIDVHSAWIETPQGRAIKTFVALRVERALKGKVGDTYTLEFLGGTVGQKSLRIPGMPVFTVGERTIVFAADNGRVVCPLISGGHGRYLVLRDAATARDYVARDNGVPLASTDEVIVPLAPAAALASLASAARALSPADFESAVAQQVARGPDTMKFP